MFCAIKMIVILSAPSAALFKTQSLKCLQRLLTIKENKREKKNQNI